MFDLEINIVCGHPAFKDKGVLTMDFRAAQEEIDSILKTLNEAEQDSGLGRDDPSVIALEEIMLGKVAALEAAKLKALRVPNGTAVEPTEEPSASPEPPLFFAPDGEESKPLK